MDYYEKLKDPRWQKLRLEILEEKQWNCDGCGNRDKTLSVHHKTYSKNTEPWDYDKSNFMVLCEECHCSWHDHEKRLKDLLIVNNFTFFKIDLIDKIKKRNKDNLYEILKILIQNYMYADNFLSPDKFYDLLRVIHFSSFLGDGDDNG